MAVTFAQVTGAWSRCNLSKSQREIVRKTLDRHGRARCDGGPILPSVGMTQVDGRNRVKCIFFKYMFEIECVPELQLVYVRYMTYYPVAERTAALIENPDVRQMPYMHDRDRRLLN
jgi:hypothetical protein